MQLVIRRSQRYGGFFGWTLIFALDARVDFEKDELALIKKYGLAKLSVYDSEKRKMHIEVAHRRFQESQVDSVSESLWKTTLGVVQAAMASLSLKVTMRSLAHGQHIECRNLDELLGAEAAIHEACKTMKVYLETAETFDGREEVYEF